jgi:hypothetical protein
MLITNKVVLLHGLFTKQYQTSKMHSRKRKNELYIGILGREKDRDPFKFTIVPIYELEDFLHKYLASAIDI